MFVFRRVPGTETVEYLLLESTESSGGSLEPVIGLVEDQEKAEDAARRAVFTETGFTTSDLTTLDKVHVYFKPGKRRIHFEPCFGIDVGAEEPAQSTDRHDSAWLEYEQAVERLTHSGLREALRELHTKVSA